MVAAHGARAVALTSLAILKVESDQRQHDYIQLFVPFILEALRDLGGLSSVPAVQEVIERRFGLRMPQGAVRTVAGRAVRLGTAVRDHDQYALSATGRGDVSFAQVRETALEQERRAVSLLREYASKHRTIHWTDDEAEAALLEYLAQRSVPVLAGAVGEAVLSVPAGSVANAEYVVGSFIVHLWENDRDAFDCVETVVKGNLLANALFFPELGQIRQKLDHVDVYVDTPLILRALGAHGEAAQAAIRELLEMLYGLGTSLRCFRQTFDETLGVLDATGKTMRSEGAIRAQFSGLLQTLLEAGRTPSDVEMMRATLARTLQDLRVEIVERPAHVLAWTVDEGAFERVLYDDVGYRREETMRHDLDSLTAIHRLREGRPQLSLEESRAILVTTNPRLVRASRHFFFGLYGRPAMPLCLADHQLATLAWLKQPTAAPDLPRRFVIADSYAALNPPAPVWRAYLEEVSRLEAAGDITTDDYYLLRFSQSAKATLMDLTRGSPSAVTAPVVRDVLAKITAEIRTESDALARGALDVSAAATANAAQAIRDREADAIFREARYAHWGTLIARWAGRLITGAGLIALSVVGLLLFPRPLESTHDIWEYAGVVAAALVGLYAVGGILNFGLARPLRIRARTFELWVASRVMSTLRAQFEKQSEPRSD